MLETPAAKAGTTLAIAGLLSAAPFGISVENVAIGTGFAVVGVLGRGFVEIAKTIEKGDAVKLARSFAWMGAGIAGAPFLATIYMALLAGIHYPVDAFTAIVLMLLGYAGPKGVGDLVGFVQRLLPARINPEAPQGGPNGKS